MLFAGVVRTSSLEERSFRSRSSQVGEVVLSSAAGHCRGELQGDLCPQYGCSPFFLLQSRLRAHIGPMVGLPLMSSVAAGRGIRGLLYARVQECSHGVCTLFLPETLPRRNAWLAALLQRE